MKITFDEAEMYARLAKIEESLKDLRNLTDDVCYIQRVQRLDQYEEDFKVKRHENKMAAWQAECRINDLKKSFEL
jgi:hypothetical protein